MEEALTFNDVLMEPRYSEITSRSLVSTKVKLKKPGFAVELQHPMIVANMKTLMSEEMADAIFASGGLGLMHRFTSIEEQIAVPIALEQKHGKAIWNHIGMSIGIKSTDKEAVDHFVSKGTKVICIDIAHGDSAGCIEMCAWIHEKHPEVFLIAGNVATYEGTMRLFSAGADAVKVGVGAGSLCSTRIETGCGVPSLHAIQEGVEARDHYTNNLGYGEQRYIIADGGMKIVGDCCKALACGADLLMCGNMFAGTDETPCPIQVIDGQSYKSYVGSSTHKTTHIEGVEAFVRAKGPMKDVLAKITDGIRSCCSYQGVDAIDKLRAVVKFVRITDHGWAESGAHDLAKVIK